MASILTVDDSATMRQMINFTLSDAGHLVTEAANFDAAMACIVGNRFDLVISDVNMPGKNGIELVKALRAKPEFRFIPILMITTEHKEEMRAAGKAAGVTGWIVKPFDPTVLLDNIKKLLA